jgi:hypothetical protein
MKSLSMASMKNDVAEDSWTLASDSALLDFLTNFSSNIETRYITKITIFKK